MILQGRNLIIKADGTAIAAARSCDITITTDEIETSSPSDGQWRHSILGRKSWKVNTSHLVPSMVKQAELAGTTVALSVELDGVGLPFNGFVDGVTIETIGTTSTSNEIYWDKATKQFVAAIGSVFNKKYYSSWMNGDDYIFLDDYDHFTYNDLSYVWVDGELSAEKLTGNAHVLTWKTAATIGNLMQGSFEFKGTGPLTPASQPST